MKLKVISAKELTLLVRAAKGGVCYLTLLSIKHTHAQHIHILVEVQINYYYEHYYMSTSPYTSSPCDMKRLNGVRADGLTHVKV